MLVPGVHTEGSGVAGVQRRITDRVTDSATRAWIGGKRPSTGFEQRVQDLVQRDERGELCIGEASVADAGRAVEPRVRERGAEVEHHCLLRDDDEAAIGRVRVRALFDDRVPEGAHRSRAPVSIDAVPAAPPRP